jgi:hypothetical protein
MTDWVHVGPDGIRKGDQFLDATDSVIWTAESDAELVEEDQIVQVLIRHADGGREMREWDSRSKSQHLRVRREAQ